MYSDNLTDLHLSAQKDVGQANSLGDLDSLRIKYLGRKGFIAEVLSNLSTLSEEERPKVGKLANQIKQEITLLIAKRQKELAVSPTEKSTLDLSLPSLCRDMGHQHPVIKTMQDICKIFIQMGFHVIEGPEVETEFNNFTALNICLDHPSRDMFDTFYLKSQVTSHKSQVEKIDKTHDTLQAAHDRLLLRSHTSPMQIRVMKKYKPPLAVIVPGKVYRPDAVDASHSFMFHQVEGFLVDTNIRFSDLKGVLTLFAKRLFGEDIKMRFRPHYFPFTEPSAEIDISCIMCAGKGCSACGRKGWLEILGSGMIHPNVFKHVSFDSEKYTGFAFGMGVERITMLKYGIDDIRLFFENDLRFLKQF